MTEMDARQMDARQVVDRYFAALQRKDFAALRPLVHDDVRFTGVMGTTDTAEDYIEGLRQTMAQMTAMERQVICAEGENVCQIYHLTLAAPAVTIPVAQWFTIRAGRIATNQTIFDPRPLLGL
jgi:ketosteroid isomerase-like protein